MRSSFNPKRDLAEARRHAADIARAEATLRADAAADYLLGSISRVLDETLAELLAGQQVSGAAT